MSVKINPTLPKHQPSTNYKPKIKPKVVDKTKQTNQAVQHLAVRFGGDNGEPNLPRKTAGNLYRESLRNDPIGDEFSRKVDVTLGLELNKSTNKTTVADYTKAFERALFNKAGYTMLTDNELETAANAIKGKTWKQTNWSLKNLRAIDDKPGQMYANTSQYTIEEAKRAGAAVLQFNKNEAETFDKNNLHGKRYGTEGIGGFVQPFVNAPVNILNGLSEPFRAGEKMLFGTNNIPVIPRMEVAERSEYWNKDKRMLANRGAEFGATIVLGGGAGAKALATKGGRALFGLEASYNFATGTYGKDVNQSDADGNPRQMGIAERAFRVAGGILGGRQVVKAEVNTPSSLVNKLDDIFKPKPPQTEGITPEGFRVKVPQTENVKGANVFEARSLKLSSGEEITIPGNRNNEFQKWFDKLSHNDLTKLWKEPKIRIVIEDRLRHPGGYHEWLPVSRAPKFKEWGVSADEIMSLRNLTKDVKFSNPIGKHGGKGSTSAHNELFQLIDRANSFTEFKVLLRNWASQRLEGGVNSLPEGLR